MLATYYQSLLQKFIYSVCKLFCFFGYQRFLLSSKHLKKAQLKRLHTIINETCNTPIGEKYGLHRSMTIEEFQQKVPVSNYHDWKHAIEKQYTTHTPMLSNSPCMRYEPYCSSSAFVKWIPYTKTFLSELNNALMPSIWDLCRRFPYLHNGHHYWSRAWIPQDLINSVNQSKAVTSQPLWVRFFMQRLMSVPAAVSHSSCSIEYWFKTLCFLASDHHLCSISVGNPTFFLAILEGLREHRSDLQTSLSSGQWPTFLHQSDKLPCPQNTKAASILKHWDGELTANFVHSLWPALRLLSTWDSADTSLWLKQLQQNIPFTDFHGKGLWTSEAVVTIPIQGKYPLAVNSHFYEFIDCDNSKVYLPWQLKLKQKVRPVLTTGSGLLRYTIKEKLEVVDFFNQCPCFTLLGRSYTTNRVGEKISSDDALSLLDNFNNKFGKHNIKPLSLISVAATPMNKPYYVLLCSGKSNNQALINKIENFLEEFLCRKFYYQLSRILCELDSSHLVVSENAWEITQKHTQDKDLCLDDTKIRPLLLWKNSIPKEFFKNNTKPTIKRQNKIFPTMNI